MESAQQTDSSSGDERSLISTSLRIESKIFYMDLKENTRGRYLKLSEKRANRGKSTIIIPAPGLQPFVQKLLFYFQHPSVGTTQELLIESKMFVFNIGSNARGSFLRVTESGGGAAGRNLIIVPTSDERGWQAFKECIEKVLSHAVESGQVPGPDPALLVGAAGTGQPILSSSSANGAPVLRLGNKKFFFDLGSNHRGQFLKITEVVGAERNSVIVPLAAVQKFQEAITTCFLNAQPGGVQLLGEQVRLVKEGKVTLNIHASLTFWRVTASKIALPLV